MNIEDICRGLRRRVAELGNDHQDDIDLFRAAAYEVERLSGENKRLQEAKRRALSIADERAKEANALNIAVSRPDRTSQEK